MKGDAVEGEGVRRGQRSVTWGGLREKGRSEGTKFKGRRADGLWENEFGLRELIHYRNIGSVDVYFAGVRALWELEDAGEEDPGFSKEGK